MLGANDVIRFGIAGIHGQGDAHIDQYLGCENAVGVNLAETRYSAAARCRLIPRAERFTGEGAEAANALLTRIYRPPFVPDKV